jgi:uncharacterized protein
VWGGAPVVTGAAGVLATYLVLAIPLAGLASRRELARRLTRESGLRLTLYRRTINRQWLLAAASIALVGLAKLPVSRLGLRAGRLSAMNGASCGVVAIAAVALTLTLRRNPGSQSTAGLLPVTPDERRLYVAVAFTAGGAEELLFRGFLLLYLTGALGWPWPVAALASSVAFGLGHLHQGARTALTAGAIGYGFAGIYLLTGSLLMPMLLHIALDLSVLAAGRTSGPQAQKCKGASMPSSRSPVWNTCGEPSASTPSPCTRSRVGAVVDAW